MQAVCRGASKDSHTRRSRRESELERQSRNADDSVEKQLFSAGDDLDPLDEMRQGRVKEAASRRRRRRSTRRDSQEQAKSSVTIRCPDFALDCPPAGRVLTVLAPALERAELSRHIGNAPWLDSKNPLLAGAGGR